MIKKFLLSSLLLLFSQNSYSNDNLVQLDFNIHHNGALFTESGNGVIHNCLLITSNHWEKQFNQSTELQIGGISLNPSILSNIYSNSKLDISIFRMPQNLCKKEIKFSKSCNSNLKVLSKGAFNLDETIPNSQYFPQTYPKMHKLDLKKGSPGNSGSLILCGEIPFGILNEVSFPYHTKLDKFDFNSPQSIYFTPFYYFIK